eukprot:3110357-Rhodomonas_salina.2
MPAKVSRGSLCRDVLEHVRDLHVSLCLLEPRGVRVILDLFPRLLRKENLEREHPKRPHVDRRSVVERNGPTARSALRGCVSARDHRYVLGCTAHGELQRPVPFKLTGSQVCELRHASVVEEQPGAGLDIAVRQSIAVREPQPLSSPYQPSHLPRFDVLSPLLCPAPVFGAPEPRRFDDTRFVAVQDHTQRTTQSELQHELDIAIPSMQLLDHAMAPDHMPASRRA